MELPNADQLVQAYEGDEPYIFICYAHSDKSLVYPEITWLHTQGLNVWYDQGISAGSNWRATIGHFLLGASQVVFFISRASVESMHCNREINLALDEGKEIFPVYLDENVELTPDFKVGLARIQALFTKDQGYRRKLLTALGAAGHDFDMSVATEITSTSKLPAGATPRRLTIFALAAGAILAAVLFTTRQVDQYADGVLIGAVLEEVKTDLDTGDEYAAFEKLNGLDPSAYPAIAKLLKASFNKISLKSEPSGVTVSLMQAAGNGDWIELGQTPLQDVPIPGHWSSPFLWKFEKSGYRTRRMQTPFAFLAGFSWRGDQSHRVIRLLAENDETGMEPVPDRVLENFMSNYSIGLPDNLKVPAFLVDRYEVTCEEFKVFVDEGGYENKEYWQGLDFVLENESISFEEALTRFVDLTGRPGPANWEFGAYTSGKGKHPVTGISWYEATAYSRFKSKSLPSVYHWVSATLPVLAQSQVPYSNFNGIGTEPVGSSIAGISGQQDSFGNAREWLLNETENGYRWIQGGAWDDKPYVSISPYALPPMDRNIRNGLRLARYEQQEFFQKPVKQVYTNFYRKDPVGDEAFAIIEEQYQFTDLPLNSETEDRALGPEWLHEIVSIDSDIPGERFKIHLFLPPERQGPYQPILYFPNTTSFMAATSVKLNDPEDLWFLPRTGRAVIYPVYWGSYERYFGLYDRDRDARGGQLQTDLRRHWYADIKRTIDYLETRDDIDAGKIGYYGTSLGASHALASLTLEKRIKVGILSAGGLGNIGFNPMPAAADPINFLPRLTIPLLILNGKYDFVFPIEGQNHLVSLLGTQQEDKTHLVFPFGHNEYPQPEFRRLVVDWYDKYLGTVD